MTQKKGSGSEKRRRRNPFRRRTKVGAPPGTIAVDPNAPRSEIAVMAYGPDGFVEESGPAVDTIVALRDTWPVVWVNIDGLGDGALIEELGTRFGIHPLALEDIVNVHQRPKVEGYDDHEFIVFRMMDDAAETGTEQVSILLFAKMVITFQERQGDCFDALRARIRASGPRLMKNGPDYLTYALVDTVIDSWFPVAESMTERLEVLERSILAKHQGDETLQEIHDVRRSLLHVRRNIWPLKDVLTSLYREDRVLIESTTRVYLRDCLDHIAQLLDLVDTGREVVTGLIDVLLSQQSNKTNDVMRLLTVMSTIFIPLSFIAGLYGMNFDSAASPLNMPELHWAYGYPFVIGLMAVIATVLLVWFYRRGWIGKKDLQLFRERADGEQS